MATEGDKTLQALKIAVQMEIDGKEYYLKVSQNSTNQLGRELFQSLAAEEDIHRQKFEEIYDAIRKKKSWPKTDFQPNRGKKLRTIFARSLKELGSKLKAPATELDAIQLAIDKEIKSYDLYQSRSQSATFDTEKDFYEALAGEERGHELILTDYYEYLKNPPAFFVKKEHHSLDGG